jgi:hypothetical protein
MATTADLFNGIATLLQTASVGRYIPKSDTTSVYSPGDTAIVRAKLPTSPDSAIALRIMPTSADVSSPFSTFLMQALVRGLPNDADSASNLADAVRDNLLGLTDAWFGDTHVVQIRFSGQVDLDADDSDRDMWSVKLLIDVDEAPTDLRPAGGWD